MTDLIEALLFLLGVAEGEATANMIPVIMPGG